MELYNLENDLSEKNNIATDHPEIVKQLEKFLADAHEDSENYPLTEY